MSLIHQFQRHETGCFTACVSMMLNKSYYDVLDILKPKANYMSHGFKTRSMSKTALRLLKKVGIKAHISNHKKFSSFQKHNKHAIFIIRWKFEPEQCHTIVYDHETKRFLDPHFGDKLTSRQLKSLERQLDTAIIVDMISPTGRVRPSPKKKFVGST